MPNGRPAGSLSIDMDSARHLGLRLIEEVRSELGDIQRGASLW